MAGPLPKPADQRARRNATHAMTRLPAEGRKGDLPEWPLAVPPSEVEQTIWAELWVTPQAVVWERQGWFRSVAVFAQVQAEAESGKHLARIEARQRQSALGLDPAAMLRMRWEVATDEVTEMWTPATTKRKPLVLVEDAVS